MVIILWEGDVLDNQIIYWVNESEETFESAKKLFDKNKYLESCFFCNLTCEKMLKAFVVKYTNSIPLKYIH